MMRDEIPDLLRRDPFLPFRIKLINGDAHDIAYPKLVAELQDGLYVLFEGGYWVFEYQHVVSLEALIDL